MHIILLSVLAVVMNAPIAVITVITNEITIMNRSPV